ncbi:sodium/proton-translocating pyrophosphatase, partial [Actinomadura adrarensis]
MSGLSLSSPAGTEVDLGGGDLSLVVVVAVIALLALAVAGGLVREVLAAGQGTAKMQEISRAVQVGAGAYLKRQFRTVAIFVVLIPLVLLLLPAESNSERIGRSVFFVIGALFSAVTGFVGMWLAVRGNVRVAAA